MSNSTIEATSKGEGLRQRPTIASTTTSESGTATPSSGTTGTFGTNDDQEDMAYSTLRNKSRPVLATAISRASAAAAAAASAPTSSTTCGRFVSGGQWMNNRELRRYRNRIVIFLAIVAIYTTYIYESGMSVLYSGVHQW